MKKSEFEDIARHTFGDSEAWRRWFFSSVVTEDAIFTVPEVTGGTHAMATLLVQPYNILYMNARAKAGYISYVATRKDARGHGYAARLMRKVVRRAFSDGLDFLTLVPASRHLYFFYDKFDFATAFYIDEERYTSLQAFDGPEANVLEPRFEYWNRLEENFGTVVLHTKEDFDRMMTDQSFESGHAEIAVECDSAVAMLFATWDDSKTDSVVTVKSLLAESEPAALAALRELRSRVGERAMTVRRPPVSEMKAYLRPYGMARIVNVESVLSILAAANPDLRMRFRIYDPLIAENTAVFSISSGKCNRSPWREGSFDLDVRVDTLTSILFSSPKIGDIFNIPSRRPYMTMMLD